MWRLMIMIIIFLGMMSHIQADDEPELAYRHWSLDLILTMNSDDTVSLIIDTTLSSSPFDDVKLMWLIPVPSMPTIETFPIEFIGKISRITYPEFILPPHPCDNIRSQDISVDPAQPEKVYLEDYAILAYDAIEESIQKWRNEGYVFPPSFDATIAGYIQREMFFVAIPLDLSLFYIEPIQITYQADLPTLPLLLIDTPNQPPITVWIFGDTAFIPQNITHHQWDYSTFTTYSEIYGDIYIWETFNAFNDFSSGYYEPQVQALANQNQGVFITEMALPTRELPSTDKIEVDNWLHQFAYVTRFRGQLAEIPPQSDIIFAPAPDFPDTPPLVDLNEYVDPLHFWGCSTRTIMQPTTYLSSMYIGRTRVYYPQGWVLSELVGQADLPVFVFAPQPVTLDTIWAYFKEQSSLPMFLYMPPIASYQVERDYFQYGYDWQDYLYVALGLAEEADFGNYPTFTKDAGRYHQSWTRYSLDFYTPEKYTFALLTTDEDVQAHGEIYDQLGTALYDYAYYVSRHLHHTLILTISSTLPYYSEPLGVTMIGFPQGWIERTVSDDEIIITPQNRDEPSVQIIPISSLHLADKWNQQEIAPILARYYGVLEDDIDRMRDFLPLFMTHAYDCGLSLSRIGGLEFEKKGRRGFITLSETYLVIASAPHDLFPHYRYVLNIMTDSVRGDNICG